MIEPGIGRIVHFRHEGAAPGELPHAAIIIGIRDSRCVNLACFSPGGTYYSRLEVPLLQDSDAAPEDTGYAEWMAFQKGQAVKTEAAESSLHPRIAALEEVLTAGGPMHTMIEDVTDSIGEAFIQAQKDVDEKFKSLGDWLNPRLAELELKVTGSTTPPKNSPPAPAEAPPSQPSPASAGEGAGPAAAQAQPDAAAEPLAAS